MSREAVVVLALLTLMASLRVWGLLAQDAYLDEGYHIRRSLEVWNFEQNPARFAHGKLLVYFWIGLFSRFADPDSLLWVSRLSLALFSVVTGCSIYLLGRRCADHATAAVALAIYAFTPLAFYFERMAMADPLASGLVVLSVLAAVSLARTPTTGRAIAVGVLLALATLAKLTVASAVLLPVFVAFDFFEWERGALRAQSLAFLRRHAPSLAVVAATVALAWLPVAAPAIAAARSGAPFEVLDFDNIGGGAGDATQPSFARMAEYASGLFPLVAEFTSWGFLVAVAVAAIIGLARRNSSPTRERFVLLLVQWAALLVIPTWLMATLITARYFVPVLPPLCLLLAVFGVDAWRQVRPRWLVRGVIAAACAAWLTFHVGPFAVATLTRPTLLPFHGANYTENIAGYLQSDKAVRAAAATLNRLSPDRIVASWSLCHLIFLHLDQPIDCLRRSHVASDLASALDALPAGAPLHVAVSGYPLFFLDWNDVHVEVLATYERERIRRPVTVVRMWR